MILGADNREAWSREDVVLMTAYQILEDERCSKCGLFIWQCQSDDMQLDVKVREHYCFVDAELEKARERHSKSKDPKKGVTFYPEPERRDGKPLNSMRAAYYNKLREGREAARKEASNEQ